MAKIKATTDGKKGGLLYGKSHAQGGIKAVVTDAGNKEIELEGGEAVVKKSALKDKTVKTLTGTNAEILNKINTEAGGNPIYAPSEVKMKNGGKISGNIEMKGSNIYADKTINEETDFIAEYLEGNGFFIRKGARSRTDFGESNYLYAHNKIDASGFPEGEGIKIRISDHSVFNFDRMNNEIHVGVTATKDSWEKSAFSVLMQLQWYYDKTNKFRKEDEIEIKKVNIEVPESQLRKNPPYPDKILSERISKSGKKQITVERTYSYPIEKWYHKESGKYYTTIKPNTFEEGGSVNTDIISPYLENLKINGIVLYDKDLIVLMYNIGSQKRNKNLYSPTILRKYLNDYSEEVANQLTLDLAMEWYDLFDEKDIPKYLKHDRIIVVNNSKVVFDNQANMAKGGSITPSAISKMTKAEQKAFYKTKEGKELDKQTHAKWKSLVNMSKGELESFYNSKEGKEAGLSASEAKAEGIDSGRESARWIMKMKDIPYTEWTSNMWVWAKKQISFVSRMKGMKGDLYDDKGNKTRKHLALLIWGHNPKKMAEGGSIESDCISFIKKSEAIKNNGYFHYFKNTSVYANFGAKDPKVKSFYLCSYNSGGQKNLKVTDTINLDLVNKLQSIIGCEKGVCIIIIDEFMRKAKRVEKNDLKRMARENILVVDRDKVTCDNINSKMAEGGNVGEVTFTDYKGEQIMFEPHNNEYFVIGNDENIFKSMEEAKQFIDNPNGAINTEFAKMAAAETEELKKGIKVEQEHEKTFKKVAKGKISVQEAIKETAEEHISENPKYYDELEKVDNLKRALEDLEMAKSVKYWLEPEFDAETYKYEKKGKPDSFVKIYDEKYNADTILAYNQRGNLVGLFGISKGGNDKGAFKIVVRDDSINKGWGKKLLDEAERQGVDIVGNIKNNSFTNSGRNLLRSWLGNKIKENNKKQNIN